MWALRRLALTKVGICKKDAAGQGREDVENASKSRQSDALWELKSRFSKDSGAYEAPYVSHAVKSSQYPYKIGTIRKIQVRKLMLIAFK